MPKELPSPELLRKLLRYDIDTGKLFWRERPLDFFKDGQQSALHNHTAWNARYSGKEAFTATRCGGYFTGAVFGRMLRAHRVAWAIHYGEWPKDQIDHINGDPKDNRINNLRCVNNQQNGQNTKLHATNTSGYSGVSWHKIAKKWSATYWEHGKSQYIGLFVDKSEAIEAVKRERKRIGYHENHGVRR